MPGEASIVALEPGEGATIPNPVGGDVTFKARAPETGGTMTVFETVIAPGEGPPLHVHANEDEAVYVLEGALHFRLGTDLRRTPSGMERFFELTAAGGSDSVDQDRFAAAGREVGMEVVGPPLSGEGEADRGSGQ